MIWILLAFWIFTFILSISVKSICEDITRADYFDEEIDVDEFIKETNNG